MTAPIVVDGWAGLTSLRYPPKFDDATVQLADFARLPNLKTLQLDGGLFAVSAAQFSCPSLQRLTLGSALKFKTFRFDLAYQVTFSPKRLPRLVNLALDIEAISIVSTRVLANILPQLETLALSDHYRFLTHYRSTEMLGHARNLKHLALPIAFDATSLLEDHNSNITLETLHLPIQAKSRSIVELAWYDSTRTWLVDSLKGRRKNVKIDKVFIYGPKKEVTERWPGIEVDLFKCEEDWMRAPFENFDGK